MEAAASQETGLTVQRCSSGLQDASASSKLCAPSMLNARHRGRRQWSSCIGEWVMHFKAVSANIMYWDYLAIWRELVKSNIE